MELAQLIETIEAGLQEHRPGAWHRLSVNDLKAPYLAGAVTGWRIGLPAGSVRIAGVDHLQLVITGVFPNSQPLVFAPGAGSDFRWPHVDQHGQLCLRKTRMSAALSDRIETHLADAVQLFNYSDAECQAEFEREFADYWLRRAILPDKAPKVLSLVKPGGVSRVIFCHHDVCAGRCVVADSKDELKRWLRNSGTAPGNGDILSTWLLKLPHPWTPAKFPKTGADVISELSDEVLRHSLLPGRKAVFLLEAKTQTGPVFSAVLLKGESVAQLKKGWRKIPPERIRRSFSAHPIERIAVNRVDGPWMHGRDHSSEYLALKDRKVVIVGCGAIGAAVANLLAQAGVGEFIFIDSDRIMAANASRHPLGLEYLCDNKAMGLTCALARRLPHLVFDFTCTDSFERLRPEQLSKLESADLIISAGIDIDGEATLNAWRLSLARPPAYLSSWVEAYAVVGHAVLLYGHDDLMAKFDDDEQPIFRLTDWPEKVGAVIVEAGCGNVFQPHRAVDLHPTIGMVAMLALDALLGKVPASCRKVWMGNRDAAASLGGVLKAEFDKSNMIQEYAW